MNTAAKFVFAVTVMGSVASAAASSNRLLNCPIDAKSIGDCDMINYAIRAAIYTIPPAVIGILILLFIPGYCIGKYCCNCCGGRNPSKGCCCPKGHPEYSQMDYLRPKIYMLLWSILGFVVIIWGLIAAVAFTTGLVNFATATGNLANTIDAELVAIDKSLTIQQYHIMNDSISTKSLFQGSPLETQGKALTAQLSGLVGSGAVAQFNYYVTQSTIVFYIFVIVPPVLIFIGFVSGVASIRDCLPMLVFSFLVFFAILLWLFNGVFAGLGLVIADVCAEFNGVANQQRNLAPVLLMCDDGMFSGFSSAFADTEKEQALTACNALLDTCFLSTNTLQQNLDAGRVNSCPTALNTAAQCSGKTFGQLVSFAENDFVTHPTVAAMGAAAVNLGYMCRTINGACSVTKCAEQCTTDTAGTLSDTGRRAKKIKIDFNSANQIGNSIDTLGAKFADCNGAMGIVIGPFISPCSDLIVGLIGLRESTGMLGIAALGSIVTLIWGAKRFKKYDPFDFPQNDEE